MFPIRATKSKYAVGLAFALGVSQLTLPLVNADTPFPLVGGSVGSELTLSPSATLAVPESSAGVDYLGTRQGNMKRLPARVGVGIQVNSSVASKAAQHPLDIIRQSILDAQPGKSRVRVPLKPHEVVKLQRQLARRGYRLSTHELRPAVDLASTYLRENPAPDAFLKKITRGIEHRPTIHGNVAEFAEAQARDMVLTKDLQSRTWDLTELGPRPRNLQIKVYEDSAKGIRSAIDDVKHMAGRMGGRRAHVCLPKLTLEEGVKNGLLRRTGAFYAPTTGEKVTLLPMKSMASAAESRAYAKQGQQVLAKLSRVGRSVGSVEGEAVRGAVLRIGGKAIVPTVRTVVIQESARDSLVLQALKAPGTAAAVGTLAIDGGIECYRYYDGRINKTELAEGLQDATAKAAMVGTAVQVLYIMAATPHGLIVAGVAIVSYVAADTIISQLRKEHGSRFVTVDDLRGIAPDEFLNSLPPSLADLAEGEDQGN